MDEAKLYETLGRKQLIIEQQDRSYQALLALLANVVGGVIDPSRVLVNLTERSWCVAEPGQRPGLPARINGLPICVTAPEPPPPAEEQTSAPD